MLSLKIDGQITTMIDMFTSWLANALPDLVAAILIVVVGFWVARAASAAAVRFINRSDAVDATFRDAVGSLARYAVLGVVLIAALGQLGFQTTSLLAALGAAGLAIGLALQGTLSNIAAGLMLLWLRPIKLGEYIETPDVSGTVKRLGLFATVLEGWDGVYKFIPNGKLWEDRITNYHRNDQRLVEVKIGIGYDDRIDVARETLLEVARADDRVLSEPAQPQIFVASLDDSAVTLALRAWVKTADYWPARRAMTEAAKTKIELAGLSIPYPQLDIHHSKVVSAEREEQSGA